MNARMPELPNAACRDPQVSGLFAGGPAVHLPALTMGTAA